MTEVGRASRPVRIWLIIATILSIPAIALGGFAAMMSPMMFDAPGSMERADVVMMFWSVLSFPVVCLVAILAAWIAFVRRRDRIALWLSLLPVVPLVTAAIAAFLL